VASLRDIRRPVQLPLAKVSVIPLTRCDAGPAADAQPAWGKGRRILKDADRPSASKLRAGPPIVFGAAHF